MKINVYKDDVIMPLFTEELRNHLSNALRKQSDEACEKMKADGWGKTKFGEPNMEYYGDFTHRFWNYFYKYLNRDLTIREYYEMSGALQMRCTKVIDGKFEVGKLYSDQGYNEAFDFFSGFKFDIEKYGIDFYKMGNN